MQSTSSPTVSRIPVLLTTAALSIAAGRAQAPAAAAATGSAGPAAPAAPQAANGLPTFLLPVPGGKTWMGVTASQLVQMACETINPSRPELAAKSPEKVAKALRNTATTLGRVQVDVPTFLLGKWPVTNKEYEIFVRKMRAQGEKIRPPFHWWRYGAKEHYESKLEDIRREFPKEGVMGPVFFWERYGEDFPYALKDDNGRPIDDQPVAYVSYRDAVKFAGWLGMRLPMEPEWTRAARGDGQNLWLWGSDKDIGDRWDDNVLKKLGLANLRDRKPKPVGSVQAAYGPFGHYDMVGQVWELMATRGFGRLTSDFHSEWKKLQKDKLGGLVTDMPGAYPDFVVVKGGSYLSSGDPVQFFIDCRDKLQTVDVTESVGFRLAKSLKPGYDMLFSRIHSDYEQSLYATEQRPDLDLQVGTERYVLDKDGFPDSYHAISMAPVNWLTDEKNVSVNKLEERSQVTPLLIGVLATTEPMLEPKLPPGIYSVAFRKAGMPRELTDALKLGHKEVQAELKRKEREKGGKEEKAEDKKQDEKKADWRSVLARFGLTEQDLEPKDALEKLKLVRIEGFEVPTDTSVFLFRSNDSKWVGLMPTKSSLGQANLIPGEVAFGSRKADGKDRAVVQFALRAPLQAGQKRAAECKLEIVLEQAPPAANELWRLPDHRE